MSRPTYGYGADDPQPSGREPEGDLGLPDLSHPTGSGDGDPARGFDDRSPGVGGPVPAEEFATGGDGGYGAPASSAPTCARHPDRVSYVRCQRCGRPTCPECQRPAAVGVLCADCAAGMERRQAGSQPRNAMGGSLSGTPVVTYTLMGLCIAIFALQYLQIPAVMQLLAFAPMRALAMPWTFVTSGFLHGGVLHLLLNMYALYIAGGYLERVMGHGRFAAVYLLSVIGGHVAVLLLADPSSAGWVGATVGASGGIFGLFGSMFMVSRRMGGEAGQILVLIGVNLVFTFTIPHVSWQGHLGGLLLGTALTAAMFALRPTATPGADRAALARRAALLHAGVIAAGFLLCCALVAFKVVTSPAGAFILPGS